MGHGDEVAGGGAWYDFCVAPDPRLSSSPEALQNEAILHNERLGFHPSSDTAGNLTESYSQLWIVVPSTVAVLYAKDPSLLEVPRAKCKAGMCGDRRIETRPGAEDIEDRRKKEFQRLQKT